MHVCVITEQQAIGAGHLKTLSLFMFSIDLKAPQLIGEGHCNTQLRGRCVCFGQQTHSDDVVIITRLPIAPGIFLFSKIMNCIDDGSWNAASHRLSS